MKILVLNLPHKRRIVRKFSCSYFANGFLYPPIELVRLATIISNKSEGKINTLFKDAIAEKLSHHACLQYITVEQPDIIACLASVDFINDEVEFIRLVKTVTKSKIVLIGYIPNLFPDSFHEADVILGNNFEATFAAVSSAYKNNLSVDEFIENVKQTKNEISIFDPNLIDFYNPEFLDFRYYSDLFVKGKTAFTYFSFGCPFKCSYCVKTYNQDKVYFRNQETIIRELKHYHSKGIKNIRILDDNCNLNKRLLQAIVDFQKNENIQFNFSGLTRIDLLDKESVELLITLGFKNLLIGIESVNHVTQQAFNKPLELEITQLKPLLHRLNEHTVELTFFMMYNPITDSRREIRNMINFLNQLPVHYAGLSYITPYPGTKFFESNRPEIEFSVSPKYISRFKFTHYKQQRTNELYFIWLFFVSKPARFVKLIKRFLQFPRQSWNMATSVLKYFFFFDRNRSDLI